MNKVAEHLFEYRPTAAKQSKFRHWHIEALLNQAADLIDRCISELKDFNSINYAANQFRISFEKEAFEINLAAKRRDEGFFKRGNDIALIKQKEINDSESEFKDSIRHANKLYDHHDQDGQGPAGWDRAGQNLNEKNIENIVRGHEKTILDLQVDFTDKDRIYLEEADKIALTAFQEKEKLTHKGEVFDLISQSEEVGKRLIRDYEDALDRAFVAKEGLAIIYGYTDNEYKLLEILNSSSTPLPSDITVTALAIWIRNAIEFLVSYKQKEQDFTKVISLKSLAGQKWQKLTGTKKTFFNLQLSIPASLFESHGNVRLKGIGASLMGHAGIVPWTIFVGIPEKGVYIRNQTDLFSFNHDNNFEPVEIDQRMVPLCRLGRVESRQSFRSPEICGAVSLINTSPIAQNKKYQWQFLFSKPLSHYETFQKIDDVLLELSLVGTPFLTVPKLLKS